MIIILQKKIIFGEFYFLFKTNIRIGTKSHQFTISRRRESNEGVERQKRLASHGSQLSKFDFVMILFSIVFFDTRSADCYFNAQETIRFQRDLFYEQATHTPFCSYLGQFVHEKAI